ncbi:metallophosphoesterase, partial [bacterium]|nr:metallophosphoesterase [bacterium]
MYVVENTTLRDLSGLARIWFTPGATPQYYPAVFTSFWVEHHLWGLHPTGYHVVNVACHAAGAILLAVFLGRLAVQRAWTTAWVFALHPVQVESVAWITERKNVLSFPLALLAGILLLPLLRLDDAARPDAAHDTPPRFSWGRYAAALALFALALLAKSVVCSLPAVLLLVAWWKRGRIESRDLLVLGPLFAIGLAAGLHTAHLERGHVGASGDGFAFSWADRVLIAGRAVVFYAWCLVWPRGLLFNYPRWTIDPAAAWQWCFPVAVAGVLAATFATRRWLGRGPFAACAAYVGILFPALGFLNVWPFVYSFVADHFQYHASPALLAVLEDIDRERVDAILCLGDVVGYGPNPCECVKLVRDRCRLVLLGNHDQGAIFDPDGFNSGAERAIRWTRMQLELHDRLRRNAADPIYDFLNLLPRTHAEGDLMFVHGSARRPLDE